VITGLFLCGNCKLNKRHKKLRDRIILLHDQLFFFGKIIIFILTLGKCMYITNCNSKIFRIIIETSDLNNYFTRKK